MQNRLRAWRTILSVKERAHSRAQTELDARRRELVTYMQSTAHARSERQVQAERSEDASRHLGELLGSPDKLAPDIYLLHRRHLEVCNERLYAADSALNAACLKEQDCLVKVNDAQRQLAAIDASLDASRELYRTLLRREAANEEELADDEAGEVAAARRHHAASAARGESNAADAAAGV
jgi:hypothetical protein